MTEAEATTFVPIACCVGSPHKPPYPLFPWAVQVIPSTKLAIFLTKRNPRKLLIGPEFAILQEADLWLGTRVEWAIRYRVSFSKFRQEFLRAIKEQEEEA